MRLSKVFASYLAGLVILLFPVLGLSQSSVPTFDPVRDDTDIFLTNPSINAERPNILILLDNTANWNTAFDNEKSALVSVVNGLNEFFNVGLAMYVETGSGNDNEDGAYVRYAVRQMVSTKRSALSTMVGALDKLNDKGNNNTIGLGMSEVYRYYKGATSYSSFGKVKTDFAGNTTYNPLCASLGSNAFTTTPTSSTPFVSPVSDGCQKNFVIYIGNGKFNENASARSLAEGRLKTAMGISGSPGQLPISPSGEQGNWADEWAQYMAHTGFDTTISGQTKRVYVNTYTIAVDPTSNTWNTDSIALMQSMATHGKGKYFGVSSGDGAQALIDALNQIFTEIQAVNSVFASTTLPVSVNVRGTNLNQVYIGMFRPDAAKAPRWYGNLKLYKLKLDAAGHLVLGDANNVVAEDPNTGFIANSASSFWTHSSNFWNYRTAEENGIGGGSDSPDGNLVEKGAVAQLQRETNVTEANQANRNLYTCTAGGSTHADCVPCTIAGTGTAKTCDNGTLLSTNPFATGNDAITTASLQLGTKDVSPLTAKVTKSVSSLVDRRSVALNNITAPTTTASISTLATGAVTWNVATLNTRVTKNITSLTATVTYAARNISGVSCPQTGGSGGSKQYTCAVTTTTAHSLGIGDTVVIAGNDADINGTYTLTAAPGSATSFTLPVKTGASAPKTATTGTVTRSPAAANSTTAVATVTAHGYSNGQSVSIAGANPTAFNGSYNITVIDANRFSYNLTSPQGTATTPGTASVLSTTATAITSLAHGLTVGTSVTVAGANPAGYNGIFTVTAVPNANTFSYTVASVLADNAASGVTASAGGGTTVTATTAAAHGFSAGNYVSITGADTCYNGTYVIASASGSTFTFSTPTACPQNTASSGMSAIAGAALGTTVTGTLANHGFASCTGNAVTVADGAAGTHNGIWPITVTGANTFTFTSGTAVAPSGSYTARCTINPTIYATANGHGYGTNPGDTLAGVTIAGATPDLYNGTVTVTRIDADNFSYLPAGLAPNGVQTGTSVTASVNTTTAMATSVNHGFANGSTVTIAGASPAAFNGTYTITALGTNQFSYTLAAPQGDATGAISAAAAAGAGSERDDIIKWVRGLDNAQNENPNGDCRSSIHGDVLHSRPAVINYNRYGGDNDVYVFYGSNDGVFRGIKGGITNDASDPTTLSPGHEAWGFIPTDVFGKLKRLRNNSPVIGSNFKKPYFMDGPISVHTVDGNGDGKLSAASGTDKVNLYVGARRGGRFFYALDVTDPVAPRLRWKLDSNTAGFGELGQTWSQPTVVTGVNGYTNPVLIMGGGYDPDVEDVENCTISTVTAASYDSGTGTYTSGTVTYNNGAISFTSTGCTTSGGTSVTVSRTMGRAIYVIDAVTGERVWSAGRMGSGATLEVPGMDFAIATDPLVVRNTVGGATNHAYFGDTGGNMWRFDFNNTDRSLWTVTKLASVSNLSNPADRRKFLYPPDVVEQNGFDAVLIGSGDREHPFDVTVTNRFYMFKDTGTNSGPGTGTTYLNATAPDPTVVMQAKPLIIESALYDATLNCVQNPRAPGCTIAAACVTSCTSVTDPTARTTCENSCAIAGTRSSIGDAQGWYFTLGPGEKNVGNTVVLNGVAFFNTNQPSQTSDNCTSNLGIARQYEVSILDASAVKDNNLDTSLTASDRSSTHAGGGYLPSPVHVIVEIDGQIYEGVISGTSVEQPPGVSLGTRTRRYWYKEVD